MQAEGLTAMHHLHERLHPAPFVKAEPIGDEFDGGSAQHVGRQILPIADGSASSSWGPSMSAIGAPLVNRAALGVDSKRDCGSRFCSSTGSLGKARQRTAVVFAYRFPTERVVRQKDARKVTEHELAEQGRTLAEIKAARRRKKFKQEEQSDDC